MSKQDFHNLFEKYLAGECSPEEIRLLENYYKEIDLLDNVWNDVLGDQVQIEKAIRAKLDLAIGPERKFKLALGRRLAYAAAVCIFLSAGLLFYRHLNHPLPQSAAVFIKPGMSQALLTLANGQAVVLRRIKAGQLIPGSGAARKVNDSILSYAVTSGKTSGRITTADSNTLAVPRGGIYETVLSDGTRVWLNSASSLKFPVAFAGRERHVVLQGEAYFEVAKNKTMPFRVTVNGTDVKVLGTHFNLMGYPEEKTIAATLLEGAIEWHCPAGKRLLTPGEQATYQDPDNRLTVGRANVADVVAWKQGFFVFDNLDLHTIMQKIARWYNVDVVFQTSANQSSFGGTISRYKNIDAVLQGLQATGSVHFRIEGRRVMVMD